MRKGEREAEIAKKPIGVIAKIYRDLIPANILYLVFCIFISFNETVVSYLIVFSLTETP